MSRASHGQERRHRWMRDIVCAVIGAPAGSATTYVSMHASIAGRDVAVGGGGTGGMYAGRRGGGAGARAGGMA